MTDSRAAALLLSTALACRCAAAAPRIPPRAARRQTEQTGAGLRYLLHLPAAYEDRPAWPLILFLHGAGERGNDLTLVLREGLPHLLETLPDFPFVVVSPQEARARRWTSDGLAALLDDVASRYRVDRARVYVTGLSSGASAALELAIQHPDRISAVAPVAFTAIPTDLCRMKDVPAWVFHNAADERVSVDRAKKLATELRACGGEVKLTIFPAEGHDAWTEAYRTHELYEWLLRQRR
ncbi:MAG TPA: PHB depolymerase family esterase [Thermoanaerobaculia bacterium]|jgi:predicted peptidase